MVQCRDQVYVYFIYEFSVVNPSSSVFLMPRIPVKRLIDRYVKNSARYAIVPILQTNSKYSQHTNNKHQGVETLDETELNVNEYSKVFNLKYI